MIRVLSLGAGVQSTTLALMAAAGEFADPLDGAIFADTQWEPAAVYRHLDWLERQLPFPVHRVSIGSIREAILNRRNTTGGRYAAIPWFVRNPDGSHGMGRRQCSSEYKLGPIAMKVRDLVGRPVPKYVPPRSAEVWIGISRDEASRMRPARQHYMIHRWPLIERLMSRSDCLAWLKARGFPEPPKSACIGCPFHSQAMWKRMRDEQPAEFAEAVAIDAELRKGDARGIRGHQEYMHRLRIPLAEAVEQLSPENEPNLFENECVGVCGV